MSIEYSSRTKSTVYVLRVQFMSRVQFISQEYSLCPKSAVYVHMVQFMSPEYSLFPKSTV